MENPIKNYIMLVESYVAETPDYNRPPSRANRLEINKWQTRQEEHDAEWQQEQRIAAERDAGTWYIRIDGKIFRDKHTKEPVAFNGKDHAIAVGRKMQGYEFNKHKKFTLTRTPEDKMQTSEPAIIEPATPPEPETGTWKITINGRPFVDKNTHLVAMFDDKQRADAVANKFKQYDWNRGKTIKVEPTVKTSDEKAANIRAKYDALPQYTPEPHDASETGPWCILINKIPFRDKTTHKPVIFSTKKHADAVAAKMTRSSVNAWMEYRVVPANTVKDAEY